MKVELKSALVMLVLSMVPFLAVVKHILTSKPDYDDETAEYVEFLNSGVLDLI